MRIDSFFYPLYLMDSAGAPKAYLGTCFPIAPGGSLLTCRHVVNISPQRGLRIGVYDFKTIIPVEGVRYPADAKLDLAYLPNAFGTKKEEFFPLLSPGRVEIGTAVHSFGFYRHINTSRRCYLSGDVVEMLEDDDEKYRRLLLPYAVIEGMSGSPVLVNRHGRKVAGICIGSEQRRIVASETIHYRDAEEECKETINRIVEFGVAYHCSVLIDFLKSVGEQRAIISEQRVDIPGLNE